MFYVFLIQINGQNQGIWQFLMSYSCWSQYQIFLHNNTNSYVTNGEVHSNQQEGINRTINTSSHENKIY